MDAFQGKLSRASTMSIILWLPELARPPPPNRHWSVSRTYVRTRSLCPNGSSRLTLYVRPRIRYNSPDVLPRPKRVVALLRRPRKVRRLEEEVGVWWRLEQFSSTDFMPRSNLVIAVL